jgi:hypothetical protein
VASPNPCAGATCFRLAGAGGARPVILIHAVDGRLVARLHAVAWSDGAAEVIWNGLDREGRPAPPGLYIATLADGEAPASTKVVVTH